MKSADIDFYTAGGVPLRAVAVLLHAGDNVAVAREDLPAGIVILLEAGWVKTLQPIPSGHKFALREVAQGEAVRRYGQVIGFAVRGILPGEHVHTHNVNVPGAGAHGVDTYGANALGMNIPGVDVHGLNTAPPGSESRTFQGYLRPDGRTGTRNYIAVISTVNCSALAARQIAQAFTPERMRFYPNVDGVIALTHPYGCGIHPGGENYEMLRRTLAGMARHPNVGAYLLVGLGCETNQAAALAREYGLHENLSLIIQELGGIRKTVAAGVAAVEALLPAVNAAMRTPRPLSELALAVQCGGSDGWSGVTANPIVGLVADEIVRQGGTVVLAETPEIFGAEHLLAARAVNDEIASKLIAQVRWWQGYTQRLEVDMDDDRSPGNAAGGLTTLYEKSLGAVSKGGSTALKDVFAYAEQVTSRGLVFMNTPGNDPISVTGQVAGGCNLVLFTTGRGSVFGFRPAPVIKISTNSSLYWRMEEDMDLNAGKALEGVSLEEVAAELLEMVIAVASGRPSKSEAQGAGEAEFTPWNLGGIL